MLDNYDASSEDNSESSEDGILPTQEMFDNPGKGAKKHLLEKFAEEVNIVSLLSEDQLLEIGNCVISGLEEDQQTQTKWMANVDDAQRLSRLDKEPKNFPLPNSANIKYPLITQACYQFASRTYPELIQDGRAVKCEVLGEDPTGMLADQAERISRHMSYQLCGPNSDWEATMDKLLVVLPNIGFLLVKTYFDPIDLQNKVVLCNYKEVILRNEKDVSKLEDLRRITHVLHMHLNDIIEGMRGKIYDEEAVDCIINTFAETKQNAKACKLYEQHCFFDLDEDGYEEPYIVTMHKDTRKILRIKARYTKQDIQFDPEDDNKVIRVAPIHYFTAYHFLPSTDGTFMGVGFGTLMLHLNETINTILNQLIDAGTLANMQGGFIDARLNIQGGQLLQDPGQWNRVKSVTGVLLKDGVMPISYKEPSQVLLQLLGMLIETGKELSSSTETMSGTQDGQNVPATTMLALVEQGQKVFSSIQRRFMRAQTELYRKLFALNRIYLNPQEYVKVVGSSIAVARQDYEGNNITVIPVADPNLSSDAQRLAKLQFIAALSAAPDTGPYINKKNAIEFAFKTLDIPHPELFIQDPPPPPPDPKLAQVQMQAQAKQGDQQIKARHQDLKEKEFSVTLAKTESDLQKTQADIKKTLAEADATQKNTDLYEMSLQLEAIKARLGAVHNAHNAGIDSAVKVKQTNLQHQDQIHQHAQDNQQIELQKQGMNNDQAVGNNTVDNAPSNPAPTQGNQPTD